MNELSLTLYDETFLKMVGIKIPDDVIWDLDGDEAIEFLEAAGLADNAIVRATRDADRAIRDALQDALQDTHSVIRGAVSDATGYVGGSPGVPPKRSAPKRPLKSPPPVRGSPHV
jgi:hypothetical protein